MNTVATTSATTGAIIDVGTQTPYGLDFQSPTFLADPYPVYQRLRDEAPITFIAPRYVVSRYDDVAAILRDPAFGRAGYDVVIQDAFGPGPLFESFSRFML